MELLEGPKAFYQPPSSRQRSIRCKCGKTFQTMKDRSWHQNTPRECSEASRKESFFRCVCSYSTLRRDLFRRHLNRCKASESQANQGTYECQCGSTFPGDRVGANNILRHLKDNCPLFGGKPQQSTAPTPSEEEAARQESNRAVEAKSASKEPGQSGSVTLNREQPPDSIPEGDFTSELRKEADTNHPIGSATRGDSKQGLPEVLPEEIPSLAGNLAGVATVTDSLASNISPLKSGSLEPMRRRGMSEPLKPPFTRLDQTEAWIRDVGPVKVATICGGTISNPSPKTKESSSFKLDTPLSGITSSQESTDSMDSDLLSVSESSEETESLESLDQNEAVFTILCEALDQLLREFDAIKKTANEHQSSSHKSSQASVASAADYSNPSQSSKADMGRKRRRTEEDEEQDQADAALSRQVRKKLKLDTTQPRFLACPYWKRKPNKHRRCCKLTLKRIRDVKQHLHRRHTPEFYCERCFVIFPNDQSHQDHVISVLCRREPHVQLDGISHSQHGSFAESLTPHSLRKTNGLRYGTFSSQGPSGPFLHTSTLSYLQISVSSVSTGRIWGKTFSWMF
jgi:hypothetical protein